MKTKIRLRHALRQRTYLAGLLFFIATVSVFMVVFMGNNKNLSSAPVSGDYQAVASGDWSTLGIWQKYNGSAWIAATTVPVQADKVITIKSGSTVTISAALTIDQIVIEAGGILSLNSGITLTLKKTTSPDLAVYGIFRNAGTLAYSGGSMATYYSGGTYQHNYTTTAGTIPTSVWNTGSTCEIYGYTTNSVMPGGLNQTFDNLKWNCASQTNSVNMAGGFSSFTGNFIVQSTGTAELQMANGNYTLTITGNMTINGGVLNYCNVASKTITINQTGNLYINGGTLNFASGNNCVGNINLTGNYFQTGGSFNFGGGNSVVSSMVISGNFSQTGGVITTTGISAVGTVVFNGAVAQSFTASGNTVTGSVDYTINSGVTVNMGTSAVFGRNFTLNSGGQIGIGSPDGITSSGSSGNIQVSGTRSYNAGGYYLYNGTGNQVTGNGLPSTINKLTINNNTYLTLTSMTTVSSELSMLSGKILTGVNEMIVTNTAVGGITGNLTSSWVIGNLRRTITSSGTFAYPVGSIINYELMNVTTSGISGITSMVGSFVNAVTNDTTYPLTVSVNGLDMTEMLDHGYWTISPFGTRTAGTYSVQVNETGYSNMLAATTVYSLLSRNNSTSAWQSIGTHTDNTQSVSGGTVTALRSGLTGFYQYGIALGDFPSLANPALISGTAGAVGATYLFQDAMRGIDMWTTITNLYNGATLSDIDNAAVGYNESFQPFVNFPANKDSYIEWEIRFKKANTSIDTTLAKVSATGVDVDGGSTVREYIVATMPTSYSLDPATVLTMSSDSGRYKALGSTTSIANIDTSHHEAMYQLNYNNVNKLLYRTGAVNTSSSATRQTSLYFRSFLIGAPVFALPIKLVEFKASPKTDRVLLNWITATETNNDYFTVERSNDGVNFKTLFTKRGAGSSTTTRFYEMVDENPLEGQSYYRLKQTDYDGKYTYSKLQAVKIGKNPSESDLVINSISPNPFQSDLQISYSVKSKGNVQISLLSSEGKLIESKKISVEEGSGTYNFEKTEFLKPGTYFIVVEQNGQRQTRKIIKN